MNKLANNNVNKSKGFTLIELVVVIVILGILAATAAPKFLDLTGDAKASVMKGVEASIESAVSVIHAKAIIDGKTSGTATVEISNVHYVLYNGYPATRGIGDNDGTSATSAFGIIDLLEMDTSATGDFKVTLGGTSSVIQHSSATSTACRLVYTRSTGVNVRPVINSDALDNC